jgi:hypothetical protein
MSTTLEDELERAARLCFVAAEEYVHSGNNRKAYDAETFAGRLRQRAAWVRELGDQVKALVAAYPDEASSSATLYGSLTGPIPSETAPADPRETPDGTREAEQQAWGDFAHNACGQCSLSVRSCDEIEAGPYPRGCKGPALRVAFAAAPLPCSLCHGDPVGRMLCSKCMGSGAAPKEGNP